MIRITLTNGQILDTGTISVAQRGLQTFLILGTGQVPVDQVSTITLVDVLSATDAAALKQAWRDAQRGG